MDPGKDVAPPIPLLAEHTASVAAVAATVAQSVASQTYDNAVALKQIDADTKLRDKSLDLSNFMVGLLTVSYITFAWFGKVLPIPDFVYAVILLPYGGAAAGTLWNKITAVASKGQNGKDS